MLTPIISFSLFPTTQFPVDQNLKTSPPNLYLHVSTFSTRGRENKRQTLSGKASSECPRICNLGLWAEPSKCQPGWQRGLPSGKLSTHFGMMQGLRQEHGKDGTAGVGQGWQEPPSSPARGAQSLPHPLHTAPGCLHPERHPHITPFLPCPVPILKSLTSIGARFVYFLMNT